MLGSIEEYEMMETGRETEDRRKTKDDNECVLIQQCAEVCAWYTCLETGVHK
jgi:hypothetical protein